VPEVVARLGSTIKSNIKNFNGEDYDGRKKAKRETKRIAKTGK